MHFIMLPAWAVYMAIIGFMTVLYPVCTGVT
jgi:hypothetical protein